MARYLVTYHGSEMPHEPQAIAEARDAFIKWAGKTGASLVEPGDPIKSFRTIDRVGTREGAAEGPFNGWSVLEADDEHTLARRQTRLRQLREEEMARPFAVDGNTQAVDAFAHEAEPGAKRAAELAK